MWIAALDCLRIAAIVGEPANDNFDPEPPPAASARAAAWGNREDEDLWERRLISV